MWRLETDQSSSRGTSEPSVSLTVVALVLGALGLLTGLWQALAIGEIISNPLANDVHTRPNDFMLYGRQRAATAMAYLHPMYASLVDANRTLPALISESLIRITGGEFWPRLFIVSAYAALLGLGVPLLVYVFARSAVLGIASVLLMCVIASTNERIYGYGGGHGFITGNAGSNLFFFALALVVFGRLKVACVVWLVHLWVHPTTAVMWCPVLLAAGLIKHLESGGRLPFGPKLIYWFCFTAPLVIGGSMLVAQYSGLMMQSVPQEYWAITRTTLYHTVFLGMDRYYLVVVFVSQAAALAILGITTGGSELLKRLNIAVAIFGAGILVFSVALVESETSPLAAATLPMRYAVVIYGLLLVNLIYNTALGTRTESRLFAGAILLSMLAALIHPMIAKNFNPLMPIWVWAVINWHFMAGKSMGRALPWLAVGLAIMMALLVSLPSSPAEWHPTGPMQAVEGLVRALPVPDRNVVQTIIAMLEVIVVLAAAVAAGLAANSRMLVRASWLCLALLAGTISVQTLAARFPLAPVIREISAIADRRHERNSTTELRTWMKENAHAGLTILGDPMLFVRRVLHHRVSVDFDLLSLVPYVPTASGLVAEEYLRDYGVDFTKLARKGYFARSGLVDSTQWSIARERALAAELPYEYVIESTSRPRSNREPVFENEVYRVYRRP